MSAIHLVRRVATAMAFLFSLSLFAANPNNVSVGAIRWDGWVGNGSDTVSNVGGQIEGTLGPAHWHFRLPFFARLTGTNTVSIEADNAAIFEQELAYAEAAGLDYFAYVLYPGDRALSYAINLHATASTTVKFAGIYQGSSSASWNGTGGYRERLLAYFANSRYQKVTVAGAQRPLVYIYNPDGMQTGFGSWTAAKAALDELATASVAQGSGNPYYVVMTSNLTTRNNLGGDAVSAYVSTLGSATGDPYTTLQSTEQGSWDNAKNNVGGKVVPWVTAGWDSRPRYEVPVTWENPPPASLLNYTEVATPGQVASQLQAAIDWCGANSAAAEANAVLLYAWNEFDEGGWICPTLEKGPDRVNAIAGTLGGAGVPNGAVAIKSWTFGASAESWIAAFNVSGFVQSSAGLGTISGTVTGTDPQLLSADSLALNISNHHIVALRMKNSTTATQGQVYFTTNASTSFGSPKIQTFGLAANDARHRTYYANFSGNTDWIGTLKRLRVDPEQGAGSGSFSIDSIQVKDTAPPSDYASFNLAGCWLLDETSSSLRAADASGNGGMGFLNGGVTWGAGRIGNCATFDGVDNYISTHDSFYLDGMSVGLTVAGWVWITNYTTQTNVPIGKEGAYRITIGNTGVATMVVATANNAWYSAGTTLSFGSALATGQWYHLAATYDGTRLRTYVNGALVNTASTTISGAIATTSAEFRLGFKTAANIDWFKGKLDEVVICRRALTAAEIGQLYNATQ